MTDEQLSRETPLPFEMDLVDGSTMRTIGDIEACFKNLTDRQREASHWNIAVRMLANAMFEPNYLRTATLSLQTALVLDGLLASSLRQ